MRLIKILFLAILLLTPLIPAIYPFGYEQVKVMFFVGTMLTCILIFAVTTKKLSFPPFNVIDKIAFVFISFLVLTSFTGIHPLSSIFGLPVYYQGAILYLFLFLFYLGFRMIKISVKEFASIMLISALVVSLNAISELIQLHIFHMVIPTYNGRVVSTFGQPNLYSGFLLLSLPFMCLLLNSQNKKIKLFVGASILLTIVALIISESRASTVLLFPLLCFYIFAFKKRLRHLYYPIVVSLVLAVGVGAYFFIPRMIDKEIMKPLDTKWVAKNAPEKRLLIWQVAAAQIVNKPILGYGLDSFQDVYTSYFINHTPTVAKDEFKNKRNLAVTRAHNYLLDLAIFSGVGSIIWIFLIVLLFKRTKKNILFIALLLYVLWVQVQIQSVVHLIYFWAFAAMINSKQTVNTKKSVTHTKNMR